MHQPVKYPQSLRKEIRDLTNPAKLILRLHKLFQQSQPTNYLIYALNLLF